MIDIPYTKENKKLFLMILLHSLKMIKTKSIKNSVKDDFSSEITKVINYIKEELNIRDDFNINYFEE